MSATSESTRTARPTAAPAEQAAKPERLLSLDASRGAIMLLMASSGLGLAEVAKHFPESRFSLFFFANAAPAVVFGPHDCIA